MKSRLLTAIIVTCISLLFAFEVHAELYTYRYTGNTFTTASSPYTTSDRVTVEFTINVSTPSNLPWANHIDSLVSSLVLSDGNRTLSWPSTDPDKFPEFRFTTNSSGVPIEWQIAINSIIGDNSIFTYTSSCVFPQIGPACDFAAYEENNPTAFVSNSPGEWTVVLSPAAIDIKPGSYPNAINVRSPGAIPVAVLTTEDFDATTVDPDTVQFAGASPLRWAMEDVDDDTDWDVIFHFKTQETAIACGDTEATLTGKTLDGVDVAGTDSVKTVRCTQ